MPMLNFSPPSNDSYAKQEHAGYWQLLARVGKGFSSLMKLIWSTRVIEVPTRVLAFSLLVCVLGLVVTLGGILGLTTSGARASSQPTFYAAATADSQGDQGAEAQSDQAASTHESTNQVMLVVDVSGAVQKPGVYSLPKNARVVDALEAAGGVTAEADGAYVSRVLNLSSLVSDQQKVFVRTPADEIAEAACRELLGSSGEETDTSGTSKDEVAAIGSNVKLISVNTATAAELDALPGIGEKRAQDIIDGRPYVTLEQLVTSGAVTQAIYDDIKSKLSL